MTDTEKWEMISVPEIMDAADPAHFYLLNAQAECCRCQTCGTMHNMTYRRSLYPSLVSALAKHPDGYKSPISDFAKLRFWWLIGRTDYAGYPERGWGKTALAHNFLSGLVSIPKYCFEKNNTVIGFALPMVTYQTIMNGE